METFRKTFRYDVFLSFRGEDTRNNFTSHLYGALKRHNFDIFHDSSLPRGLGIAPQLEQAINESKIFVVVFSTKYADSKWCLNELSQMMDCRNMKTGQIVLPVFLDVKQSDVATQQGSYNEPFINHEKKFGQEKVNKWREALQEAGRLDGLHLQDDANGDHDELLDQIVEKIRMLLHDELELTEAELNPVVGIESRIQEVISLLNQSANDDVRVVAIYGPAGIGKTTIAKATFDRLALQFKAHYCCFLPYVKTIFEEHNGKVTLQKKLISKIVQNDESQIRIDSYHQGIRSIERMIKDKKVLLILDDVDNIEQLKILGMDCGLFGSGSRIIVTTRDESFIGQLKPDATYKPRLLDESESMKVFCLNAFGQNHQKDGYEEVLREAVRWGEGRPGALIELAVYLRNFQSVIQWEHGLKSFKHNSSY